jgi:hypothetical protein
MSPHRARKRRPLQHQSGSVSPITTTNGQSNGVEREGLALEQERLAFERDRMWLEAALTFAHNGLKHLILVNGSAVVALLAFLGNAGRGGSANIHALANALIAFGIGVAFAASSSILGYLFQIVERERHQWVRWRVVLRSFAIGFAVASLICFIVGLPIAASAFSSTDA